MGLTRDLAEFVASLEYRRVPAPAIETVKRGATDCISVLFAGRDEPIVRLTQELVHACSNEGDAHILYDRGFACAAEAALVNATAAHALDYDDTAMDGHPSVVLLPAVLAEGERVRASGAELICGYVAGYETWAELSLRDEDRHHEKGWHPTAVFGTVATAAAASRLGRLDPKCTAAALGIAASMASGLVANFGSMTKPLQVGRAAQNGVLAARLAAAGVTAVPDALEHAGGFLRALSPGGRVRTDGPIMAGRDWYIERYGINIKRYPVCYALHRAIDAVLDINARHTIAAEEVEEVVVSLGRAQAGMLRNHSPRTALDAKFSAEFAMASAIAAQRVGMAELTDAFVASEPVQSLIGKVRVTAVDESDPEDRVFAPFDSVRIRLRDGSVLQSAEVRRARGHASNPVGPDELHAKFSNCVGDALGAAERERLFERLLHLEALSEAAALYAS